MICQDQRIRVEIVENGRKKNTNFAMTAISNKRNKMAAYVSAGISRKKNTINVTSAIKMTNYETNRHHAHALLAHADGSLQERRML